MILQQPTSGPVPVSRIVPFTGLDRSFNVAVLHIANRLNPRGWNILHGAWAPSNLEALNRSLMITGRISVSGDNSDSTIFGDPEVNYAFRAWHDWHHLKLDAPFDLDGETAVANSQAGDLINLYGAATSRPWRKLLAVEVIGQARYIAYHGQFPTDQIGFTRHMLAGGGISRVFH